MDPSHEARPANNRKQTVRDWVMFEKQGGYNGCSRKDADLLDPEQQEGRPEKIEKLRSKK